MSARKYETRGILKPFVVHSRQTWLTLDLGDVCIYKNGVEFRSPAPFQAWTEMNVQLESSHGSGTINCCGVVISCEGNRHEGYVVSMVFSSISKQSQARLNQLALA